MTSAKQAAAAKAFADYWIGRGYEKGESQPFWINLLRDVLGIAEPEKYIRFEDQVQLDASTGFIDGYIDATHVMIEQKGAGKDLSKPIRQSDGSFLTPIDQAKRYMLNIPVSKHPHYIITCNFQEFYVYDMEKPHGDPDIIKLVDLEKEYYRLSFLVDEENVHLQREFEISMKAGDVVGELYDRLRKRYKDPDDPESMKALNKLCVRLVFCLYAEDAELFGRRLMFHDYLSRYAARDMRVALRELFKVLSQSPNERDKYLSDDNPLLAEFPYVNGGLFLDYDSEIPPFTDELRELLLTKASANFDWSEISPTIFGAVFESTLNPETRRSSGMHYTSIENIHKVIDSLFLNDLKAELETIKEIPIWNTKKARLEAYQRKLASLEFLDPAAGSGNFLTESYLCLRRLENEVIAALHRDQIGWDTVINPIQVSIAQFHGIEINDFAVTVAQTALWIAESQMMRETEKILLMDFDFLPLKTKANIVEQNALSIDWTTLVNKLHLNYIMGNPPFVGSSRTDAQNQQKQDMARVFAGLHGYGKLDYVAAWYRKAADIIVGTNIKAAFVSTNSITQGEQVSLLWRPLFEDGIEITFAHRPFDWTSESNSAASVVCVIVGMASKGVVAHKYLYDGGLIKEAQHINGYLLDMPDFYIVSRSRCLDDRVKPMIQGNKPWDGGYLLLSKEERDDLIARYPKTLNYIKPFVGGQELLSGKPRYCLWLPHVSPAAYASIPEIRDRLAGVRATRLSTRTVAVQKQADTPSLFSQIRQPDSDYLAIPEVSTSSRRYIPIGFLSKDWICSNKLFIVPGADLYDFGIMESCVHMAWMRVVAGRLGKGYSYSPAVYNNFPWPDPTPSQRAKIEATAQTILDARAMFADADLDTLYNPLSMPPELTKAHADNDAAVLAAYSIPKSASENQQVSALMDRYAASNNM